MPIEIALDEFHGPVDAEEVQVLDIGYPEYVWFDDYLRFQISTIRFLIDRAVVGLKPPFQLAPIKTSQTERGLDGPDW